MNVMSQKEYISLLSRHLFWDMDVNKVNLDTCPAQIIQRVLEYGNLKDWQLILSYYGLDRIVSIITHIGQKSIVLYLLYFKHL